MTDPALTALADLLDPPQWAPEDRPPLEPHQVPPPGDWTLWILLAGRGAGKTEACSRYFASWMRRHPGHRGRIIGPTFGDIVESCIEGPSGLLSVDPEIRWLPSAPGGAKVVWPNGSEAICIGTPTPRDVDRLRAAGNRHIDWWEEMAANPQLEKSWGQAAFGLRMGDRPHSIASTTPRNRPKLKELLKRATTAVTRGRIDDNPHLPEARRAELKAEYAGTRIGRQELDGELLEDTPGALWTAEMIEKAHASCPETLPDMARVVVAIDPAVTSNEDSDETGIVAAGRGVDGRVYVLADRSCRLSPDGWARRAVAVFDEMEADRIVAEVNNGGDLVEAVVRTVRATIPYRKVHASRGKAIRAEPVAALYEQGRVSHASWDLVELESQLTGWAPDMGESPDRLDALVWAVTALGMTRPATARTTKGWW